MAEQYATADAADSPESFFAAMSPPLADAGVPAPADQDVSAGSSASDEGAEEPTEPAPKETDTQDAAAADSEPPKRSAQGRISELVAERKKAEQERQTEREQRIRAETRAEVLEQMLSQRTTKEPAPAESDIPEGMPPKPNAEDDQWYDGEGNFKAAEFMEVLTDWKLDVRERKAQLAREKDSQRSFETVARTFAQREAAHREAHPEYSEAAENVRAVLWDGAGQPRNPALARAILTEPDGPAIGQALGENPGLLLKALRSDANGVGRILQEIRTPREKPAPRVATSRAPELPPIVITGGGGGAEKDVSKMSTEAYMEAKGFQK